MTKINWIPKKHRLILCSSSKSRYKLLHNSGIDIFNTFAPDVDESVLKKEKPQEYCKRVTKSKLEASIGIAKKNDILICADTIVVCSNVILRKAQDREYAEFCINKLSGRRCRLYTCVIGYCNGIIKHDFVNTLLNFKTLETKEIEDYLNSEVWRDKGGACSIEECTAFFLKYMSGSFSNAIGLPLHETYKIINSLIQIHKNQ